MPPLVREDMMRLFDRPLVLTIGMIFGSAAMAQGSPGAPSGGGPGVITQGSGDVSVGGQAAARKGDTDDRSSAIAEGSSNVFINGKPAVTLGDRTGCGGIVVGGSSNVFVNGKPLARAGDLTTGCDK